MNRGTEHFNAALQDFYHYENHPQMLPFVGKYWGTCKKLLVICESHYLPPYSLPETIRDWYDLTVNELNDDEKEWTNTAKIVDETWYENKSHNNFRNIDYAIIESGFKPDFKLGENSFCYISYMNFFQRPAEKTGDSINPQKVDLEIANETLTHVINVLKPDFLFFVSSKAWECFNKDWHKDLIASNRIGHSCHPTSPHWGIPSMKYSIDNVTPLTGKQAFINFISQNEIFLGL
jgi:hypothetical protein